MDKKIIIYTDGGARGNPGPAAIGVVVGDPSKDSGQVKMYGERIENTTNNVAEYKAMIFGLKKAKHLLGGDACANSEIEVRSDSELIVNQMNRKYKIKDADLQPLFVELWNLTLDFKDVSFVHIPREQNIEADGLVNRALDTLI